MQAACKPPSPSAAAQPSPGSPQLRFPHPALVPPDLGTAPAEPHTKAPSWPGAKAKPRSAIAARHCPPEAAPHTALQTLLSPAGALSSSSHCCAAASGVLKVPQTDRTPHLGHARFHTDELAISLFLPR